MQPRTQIRRQSTYTPNGQRRHRPDYLLVLMSVGLLIIGLIVVYAISPALAAQREVSENYYVSKQMIAVLLGIITFLTVAAIPYQKWREWRTPLIAGAAVAAVAVRLFGEQVNGAYRWVHIGGLSFQAVELIKFALLIWLAVFLTKRVQQKAMGDYSKTFKPLMILLGLIAVIVAGIQSDLGSTGVLVAMIAVMCFVAGLPMKRVLMISGIVAVGTVLLIASSGYRRDRFMTFLQPERDCQSAGYQACQALIAVGSGGMFGKGLAHSGQAYGYLPEAANDSIFAIIAEKFGFVGVTFILCLFIALFTRLIRIVERAPDDFSRFLVVGILAWLSTQTLINVGAMVGLLPLKGITLPFVSYGGTSIMFVSAAVGLVFNISRYTSFTVNLDNTERRGSYENTAIRGRDRRPHYAYTSRRP